MALSCILTRALSTLDLPTSLSPVAPLHIFTLMTMENDPPSTQLPPAQRPPRRRAACQPCYQSKVKCSRGQPCSRCQVAQKDCYYELASRIGKPRGSKNRTNLRSPRLGRGEEMATTEADEGTFTSAATRHPIAPCADMIGVEGQEHTDEQQHQVPLQTLAEQSWTYSPNELNTSVFFPSFMNAGSPSRDVSLPPTSLSKKAPSCQLTQFDNILVYGREQF